MGFKENLIDALEIEALAERVNRSFGAPGSERRIDKDAAKALLARVGFVSKPERDLDLYLPSADAAVDGIVVLDNDLPLYRTSVDDVAMRKSPTVKEMLSFRNVRKILDDADVVASKQAETVKALASGYLGRLDLGFGDRDIAALAEEGASALEWERGEAVAETLRLFAALMGYRTAPGVFLPNQHDGIGQLTRKPDGEMQLGPAVLYNRRQNRLVLVEEPVGSRDTDGLNRLAAAARGEGKADAEGGEVFKALGKRVLERLPGRRYTPVAF